MAPEFLNGDPGVPRRLVRIPKAQEVLLDRSDAWSPRGFINVPPEVLQNLKDFHSQTKAPNPPQSSSPTRLPTPAAEPTKEAADYDGQKATESSPVTSWAETNRSQNSRASSEAREPSTSPPILPLRIPEQDQSLPSAASEAEASPAQSSRHPSKAPEQSPPPSIQRLRSTPPIKPALTSSSKSVRRPASKLISKAAFNNFPSSSLGSEADLEFEPPHAITEAVSMPRQRLPAAQPESSPPSAQLEVVPCSYKLPSSPVRPPFDRPQHPERSPKRRRRMKAITFDESQPPNPSPSSPPASTALPPARPDRQDRQSAGQATQSPPERRDAEAKTIREKVESASSDPRPGARSSSSSVKPPPNGPASQVPFTAFTLQYPEYLGSLSDFVRAIIEIQDLEKKRALPEFLYDDFIRAFSEYYLEYVRSFDDGCAELTASEWYNENVKRPHYMDGVMTRSSLQDAVICYPDEFRSARRLLSETRRRSRMQQPIVSPEISETLKYRVDDELPTPYGALVSTGHAPESPVRSVPTRMTTGSFSSSNQRPHSSKENNVAIDSSHAQQSPRGAHRTGVIASTPSHHRTPSAKPMPAFQGDSSPDEILSQAELEFDDGPNLPSTPQSTHNAPIPTAKTENVRTDSVPETAVKPKMQPPKPTGQSPSEPSSSRPLYAPKRRDEDIESRKFRLARFLRKRKRQLQSSVPPSSIEG